MVLVLLPPQNGNGTVDLLLTGS